MNRRELFKSALAFGAIGLASSASKAGTMCSNPDPWGNQQCRAGIDSNVARVIARVQRQNQWCWAACIEMIFAYHGHIIPQERIVQETWGGIVNMPATDQQILADLNRPWVSNRGQFMTSSAPVAPDTAAWELDNNMPLIICTSGHAMVLTALDFIRTPNGGGSVVNAIVRDPWQNNGRRSLTAKEWYATNLLAAVRCS